MALSRGACRLPCLLWLRGRTLADDIFAFTEFALENAAVNADLALGVGPLSAATAYGMTDPLYGDPYLGADGLGYDSLGGFGDTLYDDGLY